MNPKSDFWTKKSKCPSFTVIKLLDLLHQHHKFYFLVVWSICHYWPISPNVITKYKVIYFNTSDVLRDKTIKLFFSDGFSVVFQHYLISVNVWLYLSGCGYHTCSSEACNSVRSQRSSLLSIINRPVCLVHCSLTTQQTVYQNYVSLVSEDISLLSTTWKCN